MKANPIGRPLKIKSPQEFDRLVDGYLFMCKNVVNEDGTVAPRIPPEPILFTAMVLWLGLSSKSRFYEYRDRPEFSESVNRAAMLVEMEYERRLVSNANAAGPIFALKNFGWSDNIRAQQEEDVTPAAEAPVRPKVTKDEWLQLHGINIIEQEATR